MAKDDALGQLHTEKQLHASAEERCSELNRRISELDTQLRALQTTTNVCLIIYYMFQLFMFNCCDVYYMINDLHWVPTHP